jgi:hypothetical protein
MCGRFNFLINQGGKPPCHCKSKRLSPLSFMKDLKQLIEYSEQSLWHGLAFGHVPPALQGMSNTTKKGVFNSPDLSLPAFWDFVDTRKGCDPLPEVYCWPRSKLAQLGCIRCLAELNLQIGP